VVQSNGTSIWPYPFSSNSIEILLVLPENESRQQEVADSFADSVVFAQNNKL
jgi:hypothetical protein